MLSICRNALGCLSPQLCFRGCSSPIFADSIPVAAPTFTSSLPPLSSLSVELHGCSSALSALSSLHLGLSLSLALSDLSAFLHTAGYSWEFFGKANSMTRSSRTETTSTMSFRWWQSKIEVQLLRLSIAGWSKNWRKKVRDLRGIPGWAPFRADLSGIGVIPRRLKSKIISWRGRRVRLMLDIYFFGSFYLLQVREILIFSGLWNGIEVINIFANFYLEKWFPNSCI